MTTIERLQYIHDVLLVETGLFDKDKHFEHAILEAIKAIENESKYDEALSDVIVRLADTTENFCEVSCPIHNSCTTDYCYIQLERYYKRKWGIKD